MRGAAAVLAGTIALAACHSHSPPSIVVHGTITVHPENDCRFAVEGHVRPVLLHTEVVFTDLATGRRYSSYTDPKSVHVSSNVCLQTARYSISLPSAPRYRVQVEHYSAFGSRPVPVTVSVAELERRSFNLDLNADPATGE